MPDRTYLAIDLKSFYASAECAARGLDPLTTNLVVADVSRTEKTICLAVSPSLKAYGLPGRARLFEVTETMARVNEERRLRAPGRRLRGESCDACDLARDPSLKAGFIAAKPHMARYLDLSARIYGIYLDYASADDIHVYSIDEVFIDVTRYLGMYGTGAHELARRIVRDILAATGVTATAGIGTNLYLAKVAMDIVAKHMPADRDGVRVAELDETSYRRLLWDHRPLTDFWRVGRGYARRLESAGLLTMGDIARCSIGRASDYYNEELLYRMFGVNAELLIDHAWGWEPCTIADIKRYRPADHSISQGQVLHCPYPHASARLVVREMADALSLQLVDQGLAAAQVGLFVGYEGAGGFEGSFPVATDRRGRRMPKPANGSTALAPYAGERYTSSTQAIVTAMGDLFDRIADPRLMVRRITVVATQLRPYVPTVDGRHGTVPSDGGIGAAGPYDPSAPSGCPDGPAARRIADGRAAVASHGEASVLFRPPEPRYEQPDLFSDFVDSAGSSDVPGAAAPPDSAESPGLTGSAPGAAGASGPVAPMRHRREHDMQETLLAVKRRFGRNAVIKGMNLEPDATGRDRNNQIGGHAA
ncbi:type VI secretion protein ImpB [Bifidobacterium samirii]|uniref:ImpB/MucB/SamB family protein n=1 Tax=Bifidobacterium samirii TaxID=2306974 RepID=A0A430FW92_9BIFI|nr:type VI secretion protein ImpB [Bifidobacterium samirii]RSX58147.1 ImpB/MucB/SamB family protein [Bifidobacterium samirii]